MLFLTDTSPSDPPISQRGRKRSVDIDAFKNNDTLEEGTIDYSHISRIKLFIKRS